MKLTFEELTQQILELPPEARRILIDRVEGIEEEPCDPDLYLDEWLEEAERRWAEIQNGTVQTIPGEQVMAEARRLVGLE